MLLTTGRHKATHGSKFYLLQLMHADFLAVITLCLTVTIQIKNIHTIEGKNIKGGLKPKIESTLLI